MALKRPVISRENAEEETVRKKRRGERKVAPPTTEEMVQLRETETLFKSNLLRLEIEEMLQETTPLKSLEKVASDWITKLSHFLANTEEHLDWSHISETDWLNDISVCFPLVDLGHIYEGNYKFVRPLQVKLSGSYDCGCSSGPKFSVDVSIVVPKLFYRKKDFLNQTYHYKRALYLCAIAGEVLKSDLLAEGSVMDFVCPNGDNLKPVLRVDPGGKVAGKLRILCHVLPEQDTFPLKRFLPSSNNVRCWWWEGKQAPPVQGGADSCGGATPLYNNSIGEDLVAEQNQQLRKEMLEQNPKMREAVRLLRVWLTQRQLYQGSTGFSPYLVSMSLIYLDRVHKINKHMSSYQLIRIFWLYLSESDWCNEGVSLCQSEDAGSGVIPPPLSLFHSYYDVVFVDPSGYVNLAAHLDKSIYLKVKNEAGMALSLLDNCERQAFHLLFMVEMPFFLQYDHLISFRNEAAVKRLVSSKLPVVSEMDFNGDPRARFLNLVREALEQGLGDRLLEFGVEPVAPICWPVESLPFMKGDLITVGLRLDPRNAIRLVDRGPEPNSPEGAKFREVWGEKCEVRRFKDGSVCECIVWEHNESEGEGGIPLSHRLAVNRHICNFLLKRLGIHQEDFIYTSDQLLNTMGKRTEDGNIRVQHSLAELSRQLVELQDLPLEINSVHCISPVYRYAEVFPYFATTIQAEGKAASPHRPRLLPSNLRKAPPYIRPVDLVVETTFSRKWPNELGACRRLTAAFFIAIADKLREKYNLPYLLEPDCLLVHKDLVMWRLWLRCSKEISLVKLHDGIETFKHSPLALHLEQKLNHLPSISGALHGVSVTEPAFGGAVSLVKRWLSSQLIDSFEMPSVVCELLMADIVMSPRPYHGLVEPQQLFLRFLHIMATTDWTCRLVIVNFNNLLSSEDLREVERMFDRDRKSLPALVIITPYDRSGFVWTKSAPTLPTLVKLAKLASSAMDILRQQLFSGICGNFSSVFTPNLDVYDVLIKLKESMISRKSEQMGCRPKKEKWVGSGLAYKSLPVTDFDPPRLYLEYLRDNYGEFGRFVYDEYGGAHVGILLRPSLFQPQLQLKAKVCDGRYPDYCSSPPCLRTSIKSLISDFKEVGCGLVDSVRVSPRLEQIISEPT